MWKPMPRSQRTTRTVTIVQIRLANPSTPVLFDMNAIIYHGLGMTESQGSNGISRPEAHLSLPAQGRTGLGLSRAQNKVRGDREQHEESENADCCEGGKRRGLEVRRLHQDH